MQKLLARATVLLALLFALAIPALAQESRADLQNMYMDYLKSEGYLPKVDSDGDVAFKVEGRSFYIEVNEDDLEFFRIVFPQFWTIESETERSQVGIAASYASLKTKVAKAYISGDNTSIAAEIYISNPEDFENHFHRMITAITTAIDKFKTRMGEF